MLTVSQIESLLAPYLIAPLSQQDYERLCTYLELLLKWNARTNLTAIREPEEIVRRHFGESLFTAQHLPRFNTLLDFGSGAGFPGIPIQLLHPEANITLAESQGKKASFLREAVRTLGLRTGVWAKRVEDLPASQRFDIVTMRAVDNMESALTASIPRLTSTSSLAVLSGTGTPIETLEQIHWDGPISIPESNLRLLLGSVISA